jgi:hypothetical protein
VVVISSSQVSYCLVLSWIYTSLVALLTGERQDQDYVTFQFFTRNHRVLLPRLLMDDAVLQDHLRVLWVSCERLTFQICVFTN